MSAKFFGQYLLEKGKITSQQLIDAVERQKSIHTPLGALAIEKGLLAAKEVKRIHEQQKKTDRRFGELAVDMGILVQSQVSELIQVQASRKVLLGEVLVSKDYLTHDELERELKSYKEEQETISSEISVFFDQVLHKDIVETFTDLTIKMFTRFGNQVIKIEQCETGKKKVRLFDWVIAQKIEGDNIELNFLLCIPGTFLLQMASTMLNETISKADEMTLDAAQEFVNITSGNACAKLSRTGLNLKMLAPDTYETIKRPYPVERANEVVCVHLVSPDARLDVAFEF